ncbi:MAG: branched-chain amino acid ABC transporter permease [Granulosicoccus sp.]
MKRETLVNICLLLGLLLFVLWAQQADQPFMITLATRTAILALAAVGLNLALGQGGLVSLGHAMFFGIGGYCMGILASHAQSYTPLSIGSMSIEGTQSMPVIWLVTVLVCAMVALLVGALSLRTTGVYFIMITLAFGQMFYYFTISWSAYGGEDGLSIYVRNTFPGLNTLDPLQFFLIAFALLLAALLFVSIVVRSPFGLALNAARQSEQRVRTVGIRVYRLRLLAFVLSGMITGIAGALFADLNRFVSPSMFSWQTSGEIMVLVILGGVARLCGPLAGAIVFITLEHVLGGLSDYWHVYLGVLLLLIVLFVRGGIVGLLSGQNHGPH